MATTAPRSTHADFLTQVFEGEGNLMPVEAARYFLTIKFPEALRSHLETLSEKSQSGMLSPEEEAELQDTLRCGRFMELLQMKARLALRRANAP